MLHLEQKIGRKSAVNAPLCGQFPTCIQTIIQPSPCLERLPAMKATLLPVSFSNQPDDDFYHQLGNLRSLLADEADIMEPFPLGAPAPSADAALFPQMLGDAYRRLEDLQALMMPLLVVTSEFGTVSMWDWEINRYLRLAGTKVIAPYSMDQTRKVCRSLGLKKELAQSSLLVYQDNPGAGFQAEIFKRFYWWEDECTQRMLEKFGVTVIKKSLRDLGEAAGQVPEAEAEAVWSAWRERVPVGGITRRALLSAVKLYLAVKRDLDEDNSVRAVGINCLNESHFSDTTPCLAWDMLYESEKKLWGCEADTVSMLTEVLLHKTLGVPVMMTNLYPFLMGMAALKHERIPHFPPVADQPENHILAAHCGYLGVLPRSFSTEWMLRQRVLAIVDENATAIDARLAQGPVTLAKLEPDFASLSIVEGELVGYAQFPGSDCLNGAVLRVSDGHRLMRELASHHAILAAGHFKADLEMVAPVFGLRVNVIG